MSEKICGTGGSGKYIIFDCVYMSIYIYIPRDEYIYIYVYEKNRGIYVMVLT